MFSNQQLTEKNEKKRDITNTLFLNVVELRVDMTNKVVEGWRSVAILFDRRM